MVFRFVRCGVVILQWCDGPTSAALPFLGCGGFAFLHSGLPSSFLPSVLPSFLPSFLPPILGLSGLRLSRYWFVFTLLSLARWVLLLSPCRYCEAPVERLRCRLRCRPPVIPRFTRQATAAAAAGGAAAAAGAVCCCRCCCCW